MDLVTRFAPLARRIAREWGPYAMLELLMPGGSLLALALLLYRRGSLRFEDKVPGRVFWPVRS